MEEINTDEQIRDEGNNRENIRPHDISDNEHRRLDTGHQDSLQSPGIKLSFYPLCQRQYQIADSNTDHKKRDIVAVIHFLDRLLDIGRAHPPGEDTDENIDDLSNYSRPVGRPAEEVPFGEGDNLFQFYRKVHYFDKGLLFCSYPISRILSGKMHEDVLQRRLLGVYHSYLEATIDQDR